jgi:hypothetical protein
MRKSWQHQQQLPQQGWVHLLQQQRQRQLRRQQQAVAVQQQVLWSHQQWQAVAAQVLQLQAMFLVLLLQLGVEQQRAALQGASALQKCGKQSAQQQQQQQRRQVQPKALPWSR